MGFGKQCLCGTLIAMVLGLSGCSCTNLRTSEKKQTPAEPVNADRVSMQAEEADLAVQMKHLTVNREICIDNRWEKQ